MNSQPTKREEVFVKFHYCPMCAGELREIRHGGWDDAPDGYHFGHWTTYQCPEGDCWIESWDSYDQDQRLTRVTGQEAVLTRAGSSPAGAAA